MNLEAKIVPVNSLEKKERKRMFSLLETFFDGYEPSNFENDLEEKDEVLLLYNNQIEGFTTIKYLTLEKPKPLRAIFSGDTIVNKKYWGQQQLGPTWINHMLRKKSEESTPLYWFLICSGYKTYRFLPTFFKKYYPRQDISTPSQEQEILDALAINRFGNQYSKETGIIVFDNSKEHLKPDTAPISEKQLRNPHIKFYINKNPRHGEGHELACLTTISKENFKDSVMRRMNL